MRWSWTFLVIALCATGLAGIFATRDDTVTVWIDNADRIEVSVSVNGENPVRVPPGQRREITCRPGHSIFTVSRPDGSVQLQSHYLRPPTKAEPTRTYLLNPDRSRYYVAADIAYGDVGRRRIIDLALSSGLLTPQQERDVMYHRLRRDIQLLPMTGWHDISQTEFRFRPVPEQLLTQSNGCCLTTLQAIPHQLYCRLTAATGKQFAKAPDRRRLAAASGDLYRRF